MEKNFPFFQRFRSYTCCLQKTSADMQLEEGEQSIYDKNMQIFLKHGLKNQKYSVILWNTKEIRGADTGK